MSSKSNNYGRGASRQRPAAHRKSPRSTPAGHETGQGVASAAGSLVEPMPDARLKPSAIMDFLTPGGLILLLAMVTFATIFVIFTPFTHQLDELKNVILMVVPPFLLGALLLVVNPMAMRWRTHGSVLLLGLFIGAWWLSWLLNPYKIVGERVIWFQVGCATFTLVFALLMNTEAMVRRVMTFMVGLTLLSCLLGLIFNYGRAFFGVAGPNLLDVLYNNMSQNMYWRANPDRFAWVTLVNTLKNNREMYSTVLNPDFYAAYLLMMLPLSAAMVFVETKLWRRVLGLITLLLSMVCLFLTNSNDTYLSVALLAAPTFIILTSLYHSGIVLTWRFIITFLGGLSILGIQIFVLMLPKLIQTWDFKAAALDGRWVLWGGGWFAWLYYDDPTRSSLNWLSIIFGTGPGGYRHYFPVQRRPEFFDNQINNVTTYGHNHYLDILLEVGLVGLVLFLLFHAVVVIQAFRQIRTTSNPFFRFYQIALLSGLAGIALQNVFSPNTRWTVSGMTYWSLFGLSIGIWLAENPGRINATNVWNQARRTPQVAYGLALLLAFLFIARSPAQGIRHWRSAVANADGLRMMEVAEVRTEQIRQIRSSGINESNRATLMAFDEERERVLRRAEALFNLSIANNPTFSTAYYKLGHVYNQLGELEKALQTYEALNAMSPNYSEIHQNLGIMYHVAATTEEMAPTPEKRLEYLEKSFTSISEGARQSLKPNVQSLAGRFGRALAKQYIDLNMPDKARNTLEQSKKFWRNIIEYKPQLAEFREERIRLLDDAMKELALLGMETNKLDETEKMLRALLASDPTNRAYLQQLLDFSDKHLSPEKKAEILKELVDSNPIDLDLRRALAAAYGRLGNRESYIKELRRIEALAPGERPTLAALLLNYLATGQADKVLEYSEKLKAISVDPSAYDSLSTDTAEIVRISQLSPEDAAKLRPAASGVGTVLSPGKDRAGNRATTMPLPMATITVPITATIPMEKAQRTTPPVETLSIDSVATATPTTTPAPGPPPAMELQPSASDTATTTIGQQ